MEIDARRIDRLLANVDKLLPKYAAPADSAAARAPVFPVSPEDEFVDSVKGVAILGKFPQGVELKGKQLVPPSPVWNKDFESFGEFDSILERGVSDLLWDRDSNFRDLDRSKHYLVVSPEHSLVFFLAAQDANVRIGLVEAGALAEIALRLPQDKAAAFLTAVEQREDGADLALRFLQRAAPDLLAKDNQSSGIRWVRSKDLLVLDEKRIDQIEKLLQRGNSSTREVIAKISTHKKYSTPFGVGIPTDYYDLAWEQLMKELGLKRNLGQSPPAGFTPQRAAELYYATLGEAVPGAEPKESVTQSGWVAFGESVRGASHERRNKPNEDALLITDLGNGSVVAAVADGHGSEQYFRANRGSQMAVEVANDLLETLVRDPNGNYSKGELAVFKDSIVGIWKKGVAEDIAHNPFTSEETDKLSKKDYDRITSYNVAAYGTTLLAALATEKYLAYLQIGDGDILSVDKDGKVQRVFAKDTDTVGSETHSLIEKSAEENMKIKVVPSNDEKPELIMLATDGLSNSFPNDTEFHKFPTDTLEKIGSHGAAAVKAELPKWLKDISKGGSGDDITMAFIVPESQKKAEESKPAQANEK